MRKQREFLDGMQDLKTYHTHETTIHEHRAPTDQSIALLNEMTEKAKKNIIRQVVIDDNYLKAVVILYRNGAIHRDIECHARFTLNGREIEIEEHFDRSEMNQTVGDSFMRGENLEHFYEVIIEKFAKAIACRIVQDSRKNIMNMLRVSMGTSSSTDNPQPQKNNE